MTLQFFLLVILGTCIGNMLMLAFMKFVVDFTAEKEKPKVEADQPLFHPSCRSVTFGRTNFDNPIVSLRGIMPWSEKYARCKKCHTKARPCHGHGLCTRCYSRQYVRPSLRSK